MSYGRARASLPTRSSDRTRVGPEKGGEQNAQLRCGNTELVLQQRCSDGQTAAIHIVDEHRNGQQDENHREAGRDALALRRRRDWHDGVASSSPANRAFAIILRHLDYLRMRT